MRQPAARAGRRRAQAERRLAWLFLVPSLALLLTLSVYPLVDAAARSLRVENLFNPAASHFVGLRNYGDLFADPFFRRSLLLTLEWTLVVVAVELLLGLLLALVLERARRLSGLLRTLITLPVFISPVAMGLTWRFMFEPTAGVVNWALLQLGLSPQPWLSSTATALPTVMIADAWQWTPFVALILLAGMRTIPAEILEAASIDRVKGLRRVWLIVLPSIWPVVVVVTLIRLVDSVRIFDLVYVMTRGGPGSATLVASVYDFTIFQSGRIGLMASFGFFIVVFINLLVLGFLFLLSRVDRPAARRWTAA
jgi:multiple sugar transport system permease protein